MNKLHPTNGMIFAELKTVGEEMTQDIQILRTGSWDHPVYGTFSISDADLDQFVYNFKTNARGIDLCVDINHETEHRAIGWFRDVYRAGDKLFATIEWTGEGKELVNSKQYKYFSPELHFSYQDERTGEIYQNLLIGGGVTNRPFFKGMKALTMSEQSETTENNLYFYDTTMQENEVQPEATPEATETTEVETTEATEATTEATETTTEETSTEASTDATETETTSETSETSEATAEATAETSPEQFNEKSEDEKVFSEVGMTMSEIKEMQRKFSEMERASKFAETEKKIDALVFSEANPNGLILPKNKSKILSFSTKLSDTLQSEFFSLFEGAVFRTFATGEIGGQASQAFSIPATTPKGYNREGFVLDVVSKKFAEDEKISYEKAMIKARKYIQDNGIV